MYVQSKSGNPWTILVVLIYIFGSPMIWTIPTSIRSIYIVRLYKNLVISVCNKNIFVPFMIHEYTAFSGNKFWCCITKHEHTSMYILTIEFPVHFMTDKFFLSLCSKLYLTFRLMTKFMLFNSFSVSCKVVAKLVWVFFNIHWHNRDWLSPFYESWTLTVATIFPWNPRNL